MTLSALNLTYILVKREETIGGLACAALAFPHCLMLI